MTKSLSNPWLDLYFGEIGHFEFNCYYRQWLQTDDLAFTTLTKEIQLEDKGIDQFVSWDETFLLNFYSDSTFTELLG